MAIRLCVLLLGALHFVSAEQDSSKEISPYINLVLCPTEEKPWDCTRQNAARLLDSWSMHMQRYWEELKVDADDELMKTLNKRGFSANEVVKEKPSTILNKIELGFDYIRDFVETTTNQILGREDDVELPDDSEEESAKTSSSLAKKKKKPLSELSSLLQHNSGGLNQFNDLLDGGISLSSIGGHGNKHGIKFPHKYGRSVGVTRGKKKKKKVLMKVMLLATLIKGKIELLLKILSAHLQVKFFAIALIGLLINVARFWMDLKKGQQPQKVIYYEHAHHQHHYEDHGDDFGGEQSGYWKRSFRSLEDSTNQRNSQEKYSKLDNSYTGNYEDSQSMAYRKQPSLQQH